MSLPLWLPDVEYVGDYITSRTLDSANPGSDTPTGTFTTTTYPTVYQVRRLIDAAAGWVVSVTGDVPEALEETAKSVAAMRAAAMVELSFPTRDGEIDEIASQLFAQADRGRVELVEACRAVGGAVVSTVASPRGTFPAAPSYRLDGPGWGDPR